jgi:colanic acid biosynthesis glycosyl transferase WcaI
MGTQRSIILINQYFRPGDNATAVLVGELVEDLAARFDITVLCETDGPLDGVGIGGARYRVVRLPVPRWIGREALLTSRLLRWIAAGLFISRSAAWLIFSKRPSLVILASEPPFLDTVLGALCWISRRPYAVIVQDLYPEFAGAVGLKPVCFFQRPLKWLHSSIARRARSVITISQDHKRTLEKRRVPVSHIIPNWTPSALYETGAGTSPAPLPPERDRLIVHYAGNLGLACDLSTLEGALRELEKQGVLDNFSFIIRGHGLKNVAAQRLSQEFTQVSLESRVKESELRAAMGRCHVHLVLMPARLRGCVYPSKVNSIMASGRPMIASVPVESELQSFVEDQGVGYVCAAGAPGALSAALLTCLNDLRHRPRVLEEMGLRGWRYAREAWTRKDAVLRYSEVVEESVKSCG